MSTITDQFMYELFSEIYYNRVFREYSDTEVSVTETIQCLLKSFFQRKVRRKMYSSKIVILSFGDLVHLALREPLLKRGYDVELEGKYNIGNITLYAHGDAVTKTHGLETKTITRMPHEPLTHHFLQANAYSYIFGKPEWYLAYLHKPSGIIKTFPVERNDNAFQFTCLRSVRLSHHLIGNTMPIPEPSWLCKYCEYTDLCPAKGG